MENMILITFALLFTTTYSSTVCGDYRKCQSSTITGRQSIECSGSESCKSSTSIISNGNRGYVSCPAELSCNAATKLISRNNNVYCSGKESCLNSSPTGEVIQCSGQYSCRYGTSTAERTLSCGGVSSCYSATKIANVVNCGGYFGCVGGSINADGNVNCNSAVACGGSTGTINTLSSIICGGSFTCNYGSFKAKDSIKFYGSGAYGLTIKDTQLIEAYGYDPIRAATIDSGSLTEMTIKAYGYSSNGKENYIICRNEATCNLICKSNSCRNIIYQCENGAICNIEPNECSSSSGNKQASINGVRCPIIENINGKATLPTIDYDIPEPTNPNDNDNNDKKKNKEINTDAFHYCDLEDECIGDTFDLDAGTTGSLYCRGLNSCQNTVIESISWGHVLCEGQYSCKSTNIDSLADVECTGEGSCSSSTTNIEARSIECNAFEACKDANLLTIGGSSSFIECEGTSSCKGTDIVATGSSYIECTGSRACEESSIITDYFVDCKSDYSCSNSMINTTYYRNDSIYYDSIWCSGRSSCSQATIYSYDSIDIRGYLGAANAIIYGGADIEALGYKSIAFSTIYLDNYKPAASKLQLYGHLAGLGATVVCKNKCILRCEGTACKNLDYVCVGNAKCTIHPSECLQPKSGRYQEIICPNELIQLNDDGQVEEFLRNKQMQRENNDEDYKEIMEQFKMDKEEYEYELLLFHDEEIKILNVNNVNYQLLFGFIVIFVFVFSCIYYILYEKIFGNNKGYQAL